MGRAIQSFEVSLKACIVRDGRVLLVREADTGYWELPGGRIDVGEEWEAHEIILAREIAEELGLAFRMTLGRDAVTWTRRRPSDGVFQFLFVRVCKHVSGEPVLSSEHDDFAWVVPDQWRLLSFPPDSGYAAGLAELWCRCTSGA